MKNIKIALCQKSETGLEIERSDKSSDRVSHACAHKITLHNFISSSLQKAEKEKQAAIEVPHYSNGCKRLLQRPFRCQIEVLRQGKDVNIR